MIQDLSLYHRYLSLKRAATERRTLPPLILWAECGRYYIAPSAFDYDTRRLVTPGELSEALERAELSFRKAPHVERFSPQMAIRPEERSA